MIAVRCSRLTPSPDRLADLREQAAARTAQARYARARRWAGKPSLIAAAVLLLLLAGCAEVVNSGAGTGQTLPTVLILRSGAGLVGGVPVPAGHEYSHVSDEQRAVMPLTYRVPSAIAQRLLQLSLEPSGHLPLRFPG